MQVNRAELIRPTVLDEERCNLILQLISRGLRLGQAIKAAGITYESFRVWENRYKSGERDLPQTVLDFFAKLPQAEVYAEAAAVHDVITGRPGWQGPAWFLERRYPQRWGKQNRAPIPLPPKELDKLNDEQLERYNAELDRAAKTGD